MVVLFSIVSPTVVTPSPGSLSPSVDGTTIECTYVPGDKLTFHMSSVH